ncbi:GmrSD restriction endonuclease domain-containing protein [Colwellia sp. 20A7]|uniref:GmrSD restriction endonuclease domain-containing protein n=1 Tax=Colwellia sp. 20A7 TaxID=2689569 RepID=UPI00135AEAF2|nr:DUF262 domain-containing protein [Colwellia sp. 20A7]
MINAVNETHQVNSSSKPSAKVSDNKEVTELSITNLFSEGEYVIPIYQRNYAWGEPEVEQLLQDILDVADQAGVQAKSYYIGSLVAYKRKNGNYETIDGQQRHTTLSIIISALRNEFGLAVNNITRSNLGFDSRPKSDETLRSMFHGSDLDIEEKSMRVAYQVVKRFFSNEKAKVTLFAEYLLTHVKILRVIVPHDTDLNHYFEIMNNRGEQLEKHEVLKARLMDALDHETEREAFAKTWDACADLHRYVQLSFDTKSRNTLFSNQWNKSPEGFESLNNVFGQTQSQDNAVTFEQIINAPQYRNTTDTVVNEGDGTFNSVINFSNFLLHVLRITTQKDVPLDDKRLLDTFALYNPAPKDFVVALLKTRLLFDRYILKRENDEDWSLKTLKKYTNEQVTFSYVNSFDNDAHNKQLIMLLSMFHVSFPTLVYKHWLNASLHYLYQNTDDHLRVDSADYLNFLEELSDSFFFGRFGQVAEDAEPLDYFDLTYKKPTLPIVLDKSYLQQGTGVQNFIFNRLDYLLWKNLISKAFTKQEGGADIDYITKRLKGFSFTFRTSVEHYFPQNPLGSEPMVTSGVLPNGVDSFGNLCLISRSDNSKLSNYLPTAKKEHYEKATTIESLKQVFMMSYPDWTTSTQGIKNIKSHEDMMIKILQG